MTMKITVESGADLRSIRQRIGLNQEEIGSLVHAAGQTVSRWERSDSLQCDAWTKTLYEFIAKAVETQDGIGAKVAVWIRSHGPMYSLYRLLDVIYAKQRTLI